MAEGVTIRFLPGEDGAPQVMFLRDQRYACPTCGQPLLERFYRQTDYHALTLARLRTLGATRHVLPTPFEATCAQCGDQVGPEDTEAWVTTYGFPEDEGLIQCFGRATGVEFALSPFRSFDAQMQPEWEVEDDQSVVRSFEPNEEDVLRIFGRHFNLKAGWRRLVRACLETGATEVGRSVLSPGYVAFFGADQAAVRSRVARHKRENEPPRHEHVSGWLEVDMSDEIGDLLRHGPHAWFLAEAFSEMTEGALFATALCPLSEVALALERAVARLPAQLAVNWREAGKLALVGLPMGSAAAHEARCLLPELALEALLTGAAPTDWVRRWLDTEVALASGLLEDADETGSRRGNES